MDFASAVRSRYDCTVGGFVHRLVFVPQYIHSTPNANAHFAQITTHTPAYPLYLIPSCGRVAVCIVLSPYNLALCRRMNQRKTNFFPYILCLFLYVNIYKYVRGRHFGLMAEIKTTNIVQFSHGTRAHIWIICKQCTFTHRF